MPSMSQQFRQIIFPILPEFIVITVALSVLILDFFIGKERKAILGWFSLGGILIAAYVSSELMTTSGSFFDGTFLLDPFSTYFKFVFYIACGLGILVSINYLKIEEINRGEYYALMLLATSGMMMM